MPLLCLASPKGGVGKTTLAANLAWELARLGARVVALDLDPQSALRLHFGVSLHDGAGLMPALRRREPWQSALRRTASGVFLLPYGQADMAAALADGAMLAQGALTPVLRDLLADPATILVTDTSPGPSTALAVVLPHTDLLVTVLLADATSVSLIPAVEQGRAYGAADPSLSPRRHGFVLNQVNPLSRLSRATSEAVDRHLGPRLLGMISRDESVAEAIASQQSVAGFAPSSRAAHDLARLAGVIAGWITGAGHQPAPAPPPYAPPGEYAGRAW
jgi:cellulose synthase operon protein YhjQ